MQFATFTSVLVAGAAALSPQYGSVQHLRTPRVRSTPLYLRGGEYDAAARRAARAAAFGLSSSEEELLAQSNMDSNVRMQESPAARHAAGLVRAGLVRDGKDALLDESVAQTLAEFVQSDYARQLCSYCNVNPADYGRVEGMFSSVRLSGAELDVKLTTPVEHKLDQLMSRLVTHLRVRAPQIKRLRYERNGSWGTTRTWVV